MKTKIAIALAAVSVVTIISVRTRNSYINDLAERFPTIDKKILGKAYRNFMVDALTGRYGDDIDDATDEQMDALFLKYVEDNHTCF
jgi:hypothetical protein